jgi:hypothetical protein
VPFAIALSILGTREIWLSMRRAKAPAELPDLPVTAPIKTELEAEKTDRH